jgi:hypothetical protein
MTVGQLLDGIDSREVAEWQAYETVAGPLGPARTDYLFGMLASVIANVNRPKRARPYKAEQFVPKWDADARPERKPEMDGHEMLSAVRKINRTLSGKGRARRGDAS